LWSGSGDDWVFVVVQDSEVEGSGSRGGGRVFDASNRVRRSAHQFGDLHSHACRRLGVSLWD